VKHDRQECDDKIAQRDMEKKQSQKLYADHKRGAKNHDIKGDYMLVKQLRKNKITTA
jgi:hypothetical protein